MKKYRKLKVVFIILAIIASTALALNTYLNSILDQVDRQPIIDVDDANIADEIIEKNKEVNIINIALFGADNDGNKSAELRSDAIKIISIDMTNKTIKMSSLERDLVVWIPKSTPAYGHLNWAYWFGKGELAVKTINYNFDMDITKYAAVSFDSVIKIVDLVGGVEIKLTRSEMNVLKLTGAVGVHKLDGKLALAYSRIRKIDDDYHRMQRQQKVIDAVIAKVADLPYDKLLGFITNAMQYITTNITNAEIKDLAFKLINFDLDIETYQVPVGGYKDTCTCPRLGGYLVTDFVAMSQGLHDFIYGEGFYKPSKNLIDNATAIYEKYGVCVK
ncbi:MAG: LCP family protein [Erysipelotrichaceae bacterium]|nr:LCP family protein [Erysipelotrichaceae bacterium]